MGKSAVKPTVGRIVIYVWPEEMTVLNNHAAASPAVIVRTWEDTSYEDDEVNLKVLADGERDLWQTSVPYSETKEPFTWHWPDRA
jgi:hypothetical protein